MTGTDFQRRFCVHGLAGGRTQGHLIDGLTFEDAALHYVAEHHLPADFDSELVLDVEDLESGQRQCFRIDLGSGAAAPCD